MSKKYQPSNGTAGEWFTDKYCMHCLHCDPNPEGAKQCDILLRSLSYDINDPEYPSEWVYNTENKPICTNYQHWDWGTDGDPDDPENPKAPPLPPDPNQRDLFPLYPDDTNFDDDQIRIPLVHGSARVSKNIDKETVAALNKMAELACKMVIKKK